MIWVLVRWFVVGAVAGAAYFAAVRGSATRLADGRQGAAVALGVLRFGALALLLFWAARPVVMRWLGGGP